MSCLYNKFRNLHENKIDTFYYNEININPIENTNNSWNFIKQYFLLGEKKKAFNIDYIKELKNSNKLVHTVSMYYLGVLLKDIVANKLQQSFKEYIPQYKQGDFYFKFTYTWFLTCLYHDTAFVVENNNKYLLNNSNNSIDKYFKKFDVDNDVYEHNWKNHSPFIYNKELIKKYFYYCLDYRKEINHGIIGGYILYDRLYKNYYKKWKECEDKKSNNNYSQKCFKLRNKKWRIQHLDHFAFISNAIIAHNIWYNDDKELYDNYGLNSLIESNNNIKISIDKNPLVLFLSILDTIEPTKAFSSLKAKKVWEKIMINYYNDNKTIQINILDRDLKFDDYKDKIKDLESWTKVKVISNKNSRIIKIKIL